MGRHALGRNTTPRNAPSPERLVAGDRTRGRHRAAAASEPQRKVVAGALVAGALLTFGGMLSVNAPASNAAGPEEQPASPSDPLSNLAAAADALLRGPEIAQARAAFDAAVTNQAAALDAATRALNVPVLPQPAQPRTVAPVSGTLTSDFGVRWGAFHTGLDIANAIGTPVRAVADGTVVDSGPAQGFGMWVRIAHDDGSMSVYGHINETLVQVGQHVRAGDQIATVGNRGISTGPHLHFEVVDTSGYKVDPMQWLIDHGVSVTDSIRD
ncbi:M23 family metallopeptidase [Nocardia sp. NBC_01388]|uniref:M23 family metallopeptidase n=1 Tax=Nocardia sp. NBC_01388 TaxID=2903596 RepID=UPI0032477DFA